MPKMPKMPKIPKKPPKLFYEQTVGIRYKAPKQLEAELNKVLGKGNWFASQVSRGSGRHPIMELIYDPYLGRVHG